MKKNNLLVLLLMVSGLASAQNVKFLTSRPEAGKTVTFTYDPKNTALEGKEAIKCEAYSFYSPARFKNKLINLVKEQGVFKGEIATTDSTSLVGLSFYVGDQKDENPNGYLLELNKKGVVPAETYANEGYVYGLAGKYYLGLSPDVKKAVVLYEKSFALKPALKEKSLITYLSIALRADQERGSKLIRESIAKYSKIANPKEEELVTNLKLYSLVREKAQADSIKSIIQTKFPTGDFVYEQKMSEISQLKDPSEQEAKILELIEKFKFSDSKKDIGRLNSMNTLLARAFLKAKNYEKFDLYSGKIKNRLTLAAIYNSFAWPLAEKNENIEMAAEKSKTSLDLLEQAKSDEVPDFYFSKTDYLSSIDAIYNSYADTYALLLYRQGKYKEALAMQEKAVSGEDSGSAGVNERYVTYLIKDGQNEKAFKVAENLVKSGRATDSVSRELKHLFISLNKPGNYENYLADLQNEAASKAKAELLAQMINIKAPDFSLKNLKGETVSLSSLKGKVVVLDFWATWCGPCKASFPGMQKAVNKYAGNPNVVFLFVNTSEAEEGREKRVTDFIAEMKYSFNVVYDMPEKSGSRIYAVNEAFKVDGIPVKFIVGTDGNIKFKLVGYSGSDEAVIKEVDGVLGMLLPKDKTKESK